MITAYDIHWAAGLLEGEGTFVHTTSYRGARRSIRIAMASCDRDITYRLANLLGFGSLCEVQPKKPRGYEGFVKLQYRWECSGSSAGLMMTILPLMGERRAEKIKELLAYWKLSKPQRRSVRQRKVFA